MIGIDRRGPMATPRALAPLRHSHYRRLATSLALSLFEQGLWAVGVVWQGGGLGGGPAGLAPRPAGARGGRPGSAVPRHGRGRGRDAGQHAARWCAGRPAPPATHPALGGTDPGDRHRGRRRPVPGRRARALAPGRRLAHRRRRAGAVLPAYSALVPVLVPTGDLLAANGLEGVVRPVLSQAAGPAAAGFLVAALSPGAALAAAAVAAFGAAVCVATLPVQDRNGGEGPAGPRMTGLLADVREGFRYMVGTPWLLATLLFASVMLLTFIGPFEVLVPFAIKAAGGGPAQHAYVLAAFGIGGAVGSLVVASLRLPRRYLTVMNLLWGVGCIPLVVFGLTTELWVLIAAGAVIGATFEAGMVIWGTLLQRRVRPAMLGRISSLDFFVSVSFMPVSMALAGPVSELIGLTATFLLGGLAPAVLAVIAIVAPRLPADETAPPLDVPPDPIPEAPVDPLAGQAVDHV